MQPIIPSSASQLPSMHNRISGSFGVNQGGWPIEKVWQSLSILEGSRCPMIPMREFCLAVLYSCMLNGLVINRAISSKAMTQLRRGVGINAYTTTSSHSSPFALPVNRRVQSAICQWPFWLKAQQHRGNCGRPSFACKICWHSRSRQSQSLVGSSSSDNTRFVHGSGAIADQWLQQQHLACQTEQW